MSPPAPRTVPSPAIIAHGVDEPRWALASEVTAHFQPPPEPCTLLLLTPTPWPHSGLVTTGTHTWRLPLLAC